MSTACRDWPGRQRAPLMSLADTLRDRRIMTAVAGWAVLNVVFAWGAAASLTEAAGIAWEAHSVASRWDC